MEQNKQALKQLLKHLELELEDARSSIKWSSDKDYYAGKISAYTEMIDEVKRRMDGF